MKKYSIATASSRTSTAWKNQDVTWDDIVARIREPVITKETVAEYKRASKTDRDKAKDQGGFVGGYLTGGRRKKDAVAYRTLITLDADNIRVPLPEYQAHLEKALQGLQAAVYTTHSSTKERPRVRIILPLDRKVTPEEYSPIARKLAEDIGINDTDPTTYEPVRLMYWPSHARDDAAYWGTHQDGAPVSADTVLGRYHDWHDASSWPVGETESQVRASGTTKLGDPRLKEGDIGRFCQAYTITEAMDHFLPGVYAPCDTAPNRFTFVGGTTTGGLIVYDHDLHAYSHHATDPISGQDVNAFDLVRLHLFGKLDEDAKPDAKGTQLPSYRKMLDLCREDKKVRHLAALDGEDTKRMFDDGLIDDPEDMAWKAKLQINKNGQYVPCADTFIKILANDPALKHMAGFDEFSQQILCLKDLPWRKGARGTIWEDKDDAQLRNYISTYYINLEGKQKIDDAFTQAVHKNKFHQVRDYLGRLTWDGTKRVEKMLIHYLGAEDTRYTREVTKVFFKGAVARVLHPGIKFDYCLVLAGPQGLGKSTILRAMAGKWYNESFTTFHGKDAMEQLRGSWIIEMSEMQAGKRAENETQKAFITRRTDTYRPAYGRCVVEVPRQCVFAATTNEMDMLKDRTGGRRFLIVTGDPRRREAFAPTDFTEGEAGQIWAEVLELYKEDPSLVLPADLMSVAESIQEEHTEGSEMLGVIEAYLNKPLPEKEIWDAYDPKRRYLYLNNPQTNDPEPVRMRNEVCATEVDCECFGGLPGTMSSMQARNIHDILRKLEGWEPYHGKSKDRKYAAYKHFGTVYGRQRAYIRTKPLSLEEWKQKQQEAEEGDDKKDALSTVDELI